MKKLVSIIILNYNEYKYTIDCLKSLTNQTYKNFEIILVDNGSEYDFYLKLKKELKQFENILNINLIRSDLNLYFTGGNNKAIKQAKGEYVCLLNYDTVVEPDFIEKMVDFLEKHPNAGMISPKIKVYKNKNFLWYAGARINFRNSRITKLRGQWDYDSQNQKYNEISTTDYAAGTALFLKKKIIEEIGLMDDIFLMYHEDPDWNLRAEQKGYKNYYVPTTTVYHKVNRISDKRKVLLFNYFILRNLQILNWKHGTFRDLTIFYIKYFLRNLKDLKFYFLTALKKKKVFILLLEFYSILHGFRIGVKRRTHRSCRKYLVNDYYFVKKIQKKIQLLEF